MAFCNCEYTPPESKPCLHCRELHGEIDRLRSEIERMTVTPYSVHARAAAEEQERFHRIADERDALRAEVERLRLRDELRGVIRDQFGINIEPTTQTGIHTGRRRWRITCARCGGVLHEATTGPFAWHERHKCGQGDL